MKSKAILGPTGFKTEVEIGKHHLVSDEPVEKGGGDMGPTAFSLLSASLAACTAATLRYYANLKQIPLEGVEVEVDGKRRTPSEQNEAGPNAKGAVFSKRIILMGDKLTAEQREKLLAVAEKCPVNRTLLEGADMLKL